MKKVAKMSAEGACVWKVGEDKLTNPLCVEQSLLFKY